METEISKNEFYMLMIKGTIRNHAVTSLSIIKNDQNIALRKNTSKALHLHID